MSAVRVRHRPPARPSSSKKKPGLSPAFSKNVHGSCDQLTASLRPLPAENFGTLRAGNLHFRAGLRVAAGRSRALGNREIAEADEADVAALLQFAGDDGKHRIDRRLRVALGNLRRFSDGRHQFVLVHKTFPSLRKTGDLNSTGRKRTIERSRSANQAKNAAAMRKKPGIPGFFHKKAGHEARLSMLHRQLPAGQWAKLWAPASSPTSAVARGRCDRFGPLDRLRHALRAHASAPRRRGSPG